MDNQRQEILKIENARIIFRNFSGEESKFNRAGNRNFCILLENELAEILMQKGWNVKQLKPRDEEDEPRYYTSIAVSYQNTPPNVYLITRNGRSFISEEAISNLDYAEFLNVDVAIRPYNWEVNDKSGVKGYLKTMYVTLEEDEFADKYADENPPF